MKIGKLVISFLGSQITYLIARCPFQAQCRVWKSIYRMEVLCESSRCIAISRGMSGKHCSREGWQGRDENHTCCLPYAWCTLRVRVRMTCNGVLLRNIFHWPHWDLASPGNVSFSSVCSSLLGLNIEVKHTLCWISSWKSPANPCILITLITILCTPFCCCCFKVKLLNCHTPHTEQGQTP